MSSAPHSKAALTPRRQAALAGAETAHDGLVIITDRGKPVHVLLSYDEYLHIIGQQESIVDQLGLPPGIEDVEVEFPRSRELAQPADFT